MSVRNRQPRSPIYSEPRKALRPHRWKQDRVYIGAPVGWGGGSAAAAGSVNWTMVFWMAIFGIAVSALTAAFVGTWLLVIPVIQQDIDALEADSQQCFCHEFDSQVFALFDPDNPLIRAQFSTTNLTLNATTYLYTFPDQNGTLALLSDIPATTVTRFSDADFRLFNAIDQTKQIRFNLMLLNPSTNRSYNTPDKDGTLALLSDITTLLQNATVFLDSTFAIENDPDTSKRAQFDASGIVGTHVYSFPNTDGTLALLSDIPEAVTSFSDAEFFLFNAIDTTKQAYFDASLLTTDTNRTYSFPNQDGTLALLSDIPGPVTSFSDAEFFLFNAIDGSKQAYFDASLLTTLTNQTYSFPNLSGTLVLTTGSQTLTDKTLTNAMITSATNIVHASHLQTQTTAVNVGDAVAPTSGQVLTYNGSLADWQTPGGGGGATVTVVNLLTSRTFPDMGNEGVSSLTALGATQLTITLWGGGGGGGGATPVDDLTRSGGGGGGGGMIMEVYIINNPQNYTSLTITVGAGGVGGLVDVDGTDGGNSIVQTSGGTGVAITLTAYAGAGGGKGIDGSIGLGGGGGGSGGAGIGSVGGISDGIGGPLGKNDNQDEGDRIGNLKGGGGGGIGQLNNGADGGEWSITSFVKYNFGAGGNGIWGGGGGAAGPGGAGGDGGVRGVDGVTVDPNSGAGGGGGGGDNGGHVGSGGDGGSGQVIITLLI